MSTRERGTISAASPSAAGTKPTLSYAARPHRVLACVLCQQRKVKCDRNLPCANCVRSHAQCVPAATQSHRQRRRRFPERELLVRLRHYESLLRQNDIAFEPLHHDYANIAKQSFDRDSEVRGTGSQADDYVVSTPEPNASASPPGTMKSETVHEAKSFWHTMNQMAVSQNSDEEVSDSSTDEVPEAVVSKAWNDLYQKRNNDHLLFGSRDTTIDISGLHPEQIHIFKLWQVYLDNVNPLLKVTHTPTLQARIIEAASNIADINPTLAALMLGIYCVAILSLGEEECYTMFGISRDRLLTKYQFGCQQALISCGFLRSTDRDCLTALYLYLISIKSATDPQSLSSMLGVAIRIAQRQGLNHESANGKHSALEAEIRRRLWWSLVLFDARICEMSDYKTTNLTPTWDCKLPANINDFELVPGLKDAPLTQEKPSEALFVIVRSHIGETVRQSTFHLDFVNPALKAIAKSIKSDHAEETSELVALERTIEGTHLKFCNPENPLHFMAIWTARGHLSKMRLLEYYSNFSSLNVRGTVERRDILLREAGIPHALSMLECDTNLMTSSLTKGYRWFVDLYFPFPAYMHLVQHLRLRTTSGHAEQIWKTMSDNYEARFMFRKQEGNPLYKAFSKIILQAWKAREAICKPSGALPVPPLIVADMLDKAAEEEAQDTHETATTQFANAFGTNNDFSDSIPGDPPSHEGYAESGSIFTSDQNFLGQSALEVDLTDFNFTPMHWNSMDPYDQRYWQL